MPKTSQLTIFLILFFKLSTFGDSLLVDHWVVWNIGQGQWVTHILTEDCIHYDIGGELGTYKNIQQPLKKSCGRKQNIIFLSHWDFDHYFNLTYVAKNFRNVCWASRPNLIKQNVSVQKIINLNITACSNTWSLHEKSKSWHPLNGKTSNDFSIVSREQQYLMPGDSPVKQESKWDRQMNLNGVRVLILGHHGSRTSTGNDLLRHLPELKMAVASARSQKYGHPHLETLLRLRKNKTPVLKTEDWGSIWFL